MKNTTALFRVTLSLCCAALLLASCGNPSTQTGSLQLMLPGKNSARSAEDGIDCQPQDATAYEIALSSAGKTETVSGKPGEVLTIDNLEPGQWTVSARALNNSSACIGFGTTTEELEAGTTKEINLALLLNSTASITSVSLLTNPTKTTYCNGEEISLDGLSFSVLFASGYTMTLPASSASAIKDLNITCSPGAGYKVIPTCTEIALTYTPYSTGDMPTTKEWHIPLTVVPDEPRITAQPESTSTTNQTTKTLSVTASCASGGALSFQWYKDDSKDTNDVAENATGDSGTTNTLTASAGTITKETKHTYYCVITNTVTINGKEETKTTKSDTVTVTFIPTTITLKSISAELVQDDAYALTGSLPDKKCFTVTATYSDNTTATITDYTIAVDHQDGVGTVTATLTSSTDTTITTTVTVTYKYQPGTYSITTQPTGLSIVQYVGSGTLNIECTSPTTYTVYNNGTAQPSSIGDTVTYQWYSGQPGSGTSISDATTATYKPPVTTSGSTSYYCVATYTPNSTYCTTPTATTLKSTPAEVIVTAWLPTLTAGTTTLPCTTQSIELAAGTSYTLSLANSDATDTLAKSINSNTTWTVSGTVFSLSGATLTTPAATTSAQSATVTATTTIGTLSQTDNCMVTVPASGNSVTTYAALEAAVEAVTDTASTTIITIDAATLDATSCITVAGNVTVRASQNCTISRNTISLSNEPIFVVQGGGTLVLADNSSTGTLTIDGGNKGTLKSTSVSAVLVKGSYSQTTYSNLTIGENCILQNNDNTGTTGGGAIYFNGAGTLTVQGKIDKCYSGGAGGGIYVSGVSATSYSTINCTSSCAITNNQSTDQGGGAYFKNAMVTFDGSTVSSNTASDSSNGNGGGVYFSISNTTTPMLIINNQTQIGSANNASHQGGGIYINYGTCNLVSGSITGNTTGSSSSPTTGYGSNVYRDGTNGIYQINGTAQTDTVFDSDQSN